MENKNETMEQTKINEEVNQDVEAKASNEVTEVFNKNLTKKNVIKQGIEYVGRHKKVFGGIAAALGAIAVGAGAFLAGRKSADSDNEEENDYDELMNRSSEEDSEETSGRYDWNSDNDSETESYESTDDSETDSDSEEEPEI